MTKTEYVVYVGSYPPKEKYRSKDMEEARRVYDAMRDYYDELDRHPRMQLRKIMTTVEHETLINGIV